MEDIKTSGVMGSAANRKALRLKRNIWCGGIILVVAILAAAGVLALSSNSSFNENKSINTKEYQAVFLTNGQVYFGKISDLNHKYVSITDIYYLQVQQSADNNTSLQNASGSSDKNSQVSLAKLGNELHGPEDKMSVASDQVLFWENMKNDSKVSQAITKYRQTQ